jgi:hypothetical protein
MENLPQTIEVGPYRYRVLTDIDAQITLAGHSPDSQDEDHDGCVGLTDPHTLTILLDPTQASDALRATFAHELIHAIANLCDLGDDNSEEDWAARLGPQLCDVLRRNPAVVAYLTGVLQ